MQTFLPYPDFAETAKVLDQRRLGKQRVEALQVLRGLTVPGYGWRHHPAVRMWRGYEEALTRYGLEICRVWREAGHKDTCTGLLRAELRAARAIDHPRDQYALAEAGEADRCLIACFDSPADPVNGPAFPHVRQDQRRMGREAVDLLLAQIRGEEPPKKSIIPFALIDPKKT